MGEGGWASSRFADGCGLGAFKRLTLTQMDCISKIINSKVVVCDSLKASNHENVRRIQSGKARGIL